MERLLIVLGIIFIATGLSWRFIKKSGLGHLPGDIVIKNDVVYASTFGLKIVSECTSIAPTAILISGIIAFPSNLSQKLTGAVVGIIVLGFLNLIRTSSLLYIGSIYPSVFETAHILVWQSLMIATAIFLWLLWWKYLVNNNFSLKL